MTTVERDAYFVIHTTMRSGFECKIPARGYNLKSWLAFEDKLGSTYYYEQTTKEVYEHLVFGDPNAILDTEDDDERRVSKRETQQKTPTKRKPRAKASGDSEEILKPRRSSKPSAKRASPTSKTTRNELREPKVRNVRKPKKDVARTDDSGKATPTRTRTTKRQTK